ncbi:MAG TPA: N-succinylarginine dihydrolase, partial [Croceicoccus sp.]|nr:N-succinylarginine dihydrolase [Croceicoccus sp.]
SMANGGGPACLRLRVVADPASVDPRFLMSPDKLESMAAVVADHWPESIDPADIGSPQLADRIVSARNFMLECLNLKELG